MVVLYLYLFLVLSYVTLLAVQSWHSPSDSSASCSLHQSVDVSPLKPTPNEVLPEAKGTATSGVPDSIFVPFFASFFIDVFWDRITLLFLRWFYSAYIVSKTNLEFMQALKVL